MKKRKQPLLVARKRADLIRSLGGRCVVCGATDKLQFDHKESRDWLPERLSRQKRFKVYDRAAAEGKVQLLCATCHAAKSAREGAGYDPLSRFVNLEPLLTAEPLRKPVTAFLVVKL